MKSNLKKKITGFIKIGQCKKHAKIPGKKISEIAAFILPFLFVCVLAVMTFVPDMSDKPNLYSDSHVSESSREKETECVPIEIISADNENFDAEDYELLTSK